MEFLFNINLPFKEKKEKERKKKQCCYSTPHTQHTSGERLSLAPLNCLSEHKPTLIFSGTKKQNMTLSCFYDAARTNGREQWITQPTHNVQVKESIHIYTLHL